MQKIILVLFLVSILVCLIGCESPLFQAVFQEQKWSENYVLADGVICTSPEMIDGDINTVGKAHFPDRVGGRTVYGAFPNAEVDITLPEKKSIHKIVIYSNKLESFRVMASIGTGENWKEIANLDNNTEKMIVIKASVVTDKIKIRARPISGNSSIAARDVGLAGRVRQMLEPEIQEIELYGFASN